MRKIPRTYRIPTETDEAIKVLARNEGTSEADVIVRAVAEYIPGKPQTVKQPNAPTSEERKPLFKPSGKL